MRSVFKLWQVLHNRITPDESASHMESSIQQHHS
jgi:hypothetical protein